MQWVYFVIFAYIVFPLPLKAQGDALLTGEGEKESYPSLLYISEYFSFVGWDETGRVAFVLDNNRGRDGDTYQAEHFSILHDENLGWIEVEGNGHYDVVDRDLSKIPDSRFFQFKGRPPDGILISSPSNALTLQVHPTRSAMIRKVESSEFRLEFAPAKMQWKNRFLEGRVIYEYLYMPDFNRLSRTYWGLWKDFQGFYASVRGEGDFYLHSQKGEMISALVGPLLGFLTFEEEPNPMQSIQFTVLKRDLALGFYRWPKSWRIHWTGPQGPASIEFEVMDRRVLANWIVGGFAMGIIQGEIEYDGRAWPFYGLAELLM